MKNQGTELEQFFDRSQSEASKGNVRGLKVLVRPLALADFRLKASQAIARICLNRKMTSTTPDAFLVDQSSDPEPVLYLVPITGYDPRAFAINWMEGGKHARCNLFEAFAEYGIRTYPDMNTLMPVDAYEHPEHKWVLRIRYANPEVTPVKHRDKRSAETPAAARAPTER